MQTPAFTNPDNRRPAVKFTGILRSVGTPLGPGARVLDFGCGCGDLVRDLAAEKLDAYGCDFEVPAHEGQSVERLRAIDPQNYRIPFDDGTFDAVISNQVFEHVQDYGAAIREIARVLNPQGVTLHIFPSCFRLVEPHVFVPLATRLQSYWWLRMWAAVGVRNGYQSGLPGEEVARRNHRYLGNETNYLSRGTIRDEFSRWFGQVEFCDREFVRHLSKSWLGPLDDLTLGAFSRGVSGLHSRVLYAARPCSAAVS